MDKAIVGCEGATCPTVTVGGFTGLGASVADFWVLSLQPDTPGTPLAGVGTVLIGLPWTRFLIGAPGAPLSVSAIPPTCDLVGREFYTQGGAIDAAGAIGLTNALDFVIGTDGV